MHCVFQCAFSNIWHGARQDLLFVLNPNKDEVHIIGTLSWIMDRKLVGNLLASVRISSRHSPSWKASSFATKSVLRFWQCLSASARGCALGHSCIFHRTAKAQMLRMAAFEKLQWGNFLASFQEQSSEAPQNRRLVSKVAYFRSSYCLHIFLCLINRNLQYQGAMVILHCILDHVTNSQVLHTQGKCAQNPLPRMIRHPITATPHTHTPHAHIQTQIQNTMMFIKWGHRPACYSQLLLIKEMTANLAVQSAQCTAATFYSVFVSKSNPVTG